VANDSVRASDSGVDTGNAPTLRVTASDPVICDAPSDREELGPYRAQAFEGWKQAVGDAALAGRGVAVQDFDGDGKLDLLVADVLSLVLLRGDGEGDFAAEAVEAGTSTVGLAAADVDDDGWVDVVLARRGAGDRLMRGGAKGFEVDDASGLSGEAWGSVHASWADVDGDGDLDLAIAGHSARSFDAEDPEPGDPSQLYLNDEGTLRPVDLPQELNDGYSFVFALQDLDGAQGPELYLVNDHGSQVIGNRGFRWDGGAMTPMLGVGLDLPIEGMGLGVGDVNGDGVPDLLMSSWGELALLESDGVGGWYDAALSRGLELPEASPAAWGTELADLDNDGDLDAVIAAGWFRALSDHAPNPEEQPDMIWENLGGSFTEAGASWGWDDRGLGRGVVVADLNADGWLDLVRAPLGGPVGVHLARCGAAHWLTVSLEQPAPNRQGIGARIELDLAGSTLVRWLSAGGTSLHVSGPPVAHFGLGADSDVEALRVVWPDGIVDEVAVPGADRHMVVQRSEVR